MTPDRSDTFQLPEPEILSELIRRSERAGKKLSTLTIDSDIRFASQQAQREFGEELARTVAQLAHKYHDEDAPNGRTFRVVACAYQAIMKPEDDQPGEGSPSESREHDHDS